MSTPEYTEDQKKEYRDYLAELSVATNPKHKKEVLKKIKAAGFKFVEPNEENAPHLNRRMGYDIYLNENIVRNDPELGVKIAVAEAFQALTRTIRLDDLCRANGVSNALQEPSEDELPKKEDK